MKRTALVRKTALRSTCTLQRVGFLRRGAFVPKRTPAPRIRLWQDMRSRVFVRSAGLCDICGGYLNPNVWECHHRVLRSQGGRDDMHNLLALHLGCHTKAHNNRDWARVHGYIVHPSIDPAAYPVFRHGLFWQVPTVGQWVGAASPIEEEVA